MLVAFYFVTIVTIFLDFALPAVEVEVEVEVCLCFSTMRLRRALDRLPLTATTHSTTKTTTTSLAYDLRLSTFAGWPFDCYESPFQPLQGVGLVARDDQGTTAAVVGRRRP
jgi:hypothetical protein